MSCRVFVIAEFSVTRRGDFSRCGGFLIARDRDVLMKSAADKRTRVRETLNYAHSSALKLRHAMIKSGRVAHDRKIDTRAFRERKRSAVERIRRSCPSLAVVDRE